MQAFEATRKNLRIVITADPEIMVPPSHYGGIERVIHMLVVGLSKRGHNVSLFANRNSQTPARLIPYRGLTSSSLNDTFSNALDITQYLRKNGDVDIVHSFGRLAYLLPILGGKTPKIQSYQRYVSPRSVRFGSKIAGSSLTFTACSQSCARSAGLTETDWVVIHNGVPLENYSFVPQVAPDAPFVFLGRVERIKGAHTAIRAAQESGRKLVIAGNCAEHGVERQYFEREILPFCDGKNVTYVGPVNDEQKNKLLGEALALLFPIEWEEPFGIVMAEALACGTPVVGFRRGAVPEVVQDRRTGFVCDTEEDFVSALNRITAIDRLDCRRAAEQFFSDDVIVDQYERLYYSKTRQYLN